MTTDAELHLKENTSTSKPGLKPIPQATEIPVPFLYSASDDGIDENLLIILHGLGDTHVPFGKLARQWRLPQTATLVLRAPLQIPFLYEDAFQWYPSFDQLGDLIERPNPTVALDLMMKILGYLTTVCTWPPKNLHLFGFAQGGSIATEACLRWWQDQFRRASKFESDSSSSTASALGSVVTIGGPLLSHPTLSLICPTPLLAFYRSPSSEPSLKPGDLASLRKGFSFVKEMKLSGQGMPRSKDEWHPIMEFWSQRLKRRQLDGLYEVMTGSFSL